MKIIKDNLIISENSQRFTINKHDEQHLINMLKVLLPISDETSGVHQIQNINIEEITTYYIQLINYTCKQKGKPFGAKLFKELHAYATNVARGYAPEPIPWNKIRKGHPYQLRYVIPLLQSNVPSLQRLALTITRIYELIYTSPQWDPSVVTDEGPGLDNQFQTEFRKFIKGWFDKLRINPAKLKLKNFLSTRKMGPNGPALMYAHADAVAILRDREVLLNLQRYCKVTGNTETFDRMIELAWDNKELFPEKLKVGKVSLLSEGGGKTRAIAIADYWTQNVLYPMHSSLMSILRKLKTDGTYDQESQFERIKKETVGYPTYCFDLTSATDRFPLHLQSILIQDLYGPKVSDAWSKLISQRNFSFNKTNVRWAYGQPLGLYSSWAAFSLTHHALIEYCAYKEGFQSFTQYAVLGDDVCIWNAEVAQRYSSLIQELGVSINYTKTVTSDKHRQVIEFAKRNIITGAEITGIKPKILLTGNTLSGFVNLIKFANSRSYEVSTSVVRSLDFISEKRKSKLNKLFWYLFGESFAPIEGLTNLTPSVQDLELVKRLVYQVRLEILKSRRALVHKIMADIDSADQNFENRGLRYNKISFGSTGEIERLHPLILHLADLVEELEDSTTTLENQLLQFNLEEEIPIKPIEYFPTFSIESYFGDQKELLNTHQTFLILEAFNRLLKGDDIPSIINFLGNNNKDTLTR